MSTNPARLFYGWNVSPDGSRLAVLTDAEHGNQIRIFSLPGGEVHDLTVEGWTGFTILNWLADGKAMILSSETSYGTTLLYVDLKGRAHPLWEQRASPWSFAVASRDGRFLAVSAVSISSNIWMLENF